MDNKAIVSSEKNIQLITVPEQWMKVMKWINNPIWGKPDRAQAINASKEFLFAVKLENLKFDEAMLKALLGNCRIQ